jgi:hypothetical protein
MAIHPTSIALGSSHVRSPQHSNIRVVRPLLVSSMVRINRGEPPQRLQSFGAGLVSMVRFPRAWNPWKC